MKRHLAAAMAGLFLIAPAGAAAPAVKLDAIRIQLFYASSGTLSEDVSKSSDTFWNTIIGEGSAKEPADDLLVSVVLTSVSDEANVDKPVTLIVRDDKHKVLAKRVFADPFLKNHRVVLPLLVQNAGCAGDVAIEASFAGQKKTAHIAMNCGE